LPLPRTNGGCPLPPGTLRLRLGSIVSPRSTGPGRRLSGRNWTSRRAPWASTPIFAR
jgi:hypothetical protein